MGPPAWRTWTTGAALALGCLLAAALPVEAMDYTAYERLLRAHVRPGTVGGVPRHLVDYRALNEGSNYPRALRDFAAAKPEAFQIQADRAAAWPSSSGRTPTRPWRLGWPASATAASPTWSTTGA